MLAVLIASWLGGGGRRSRVRRRRGRTGRRDPIVELDLAGRPVGRHLFGVALWLPALYFAFGFVAARLAELLVAGFAGAQAERIALIAEQVDARSRPSARLDSRVQLTSRPARQSRSG
jgi:hypothetical protein